MAYQQAGTRPAALRAALRRQAADTAAREVLDTLRHVGARLSACRLTISATQHTVAVLVSPLHTSARLRHLEDKNMNGGPYGVGQQVRQGGSYVCRVHDGTLTFPPPQSFIDCPKHNEAPNQACLWYGPQVAGNEGHEHEPPRDEEESRERARSRRDQD